LKINPDSRIKKVVSLVHCEVTQATCSTNGTSTTRTCVCVNLTSPQQAGDRPNLLCLVVIATLRIDPIFLCNHAYDYISCFLFPILYLCFRLLFCLFVSHRV
jgi:hypothetical protein